MGYHYYIDKRASCPPGQGDCPPLPRLVTDSTKPPGNARFYFRSLIIAALVAITLLWATPRLAPSSDLLTYAVARLQARLVGGYYSPAHRDDTTVLLIDDASLERQNVGWPVPYQTHARWLRNIGLIYKPRAIFLDITFASERGDPTLPQLVAALCELRDAGVPVFLAALPDDDGHLRLRSGLAPTDGQAPCFTMVDVRYAPSKVDRLVWSYPLWSDGDARSAALAIAQDAAGVRIPKSDDTMALTWGVNNLDQRRFTPHCRQTRGGYVEMLPAYVRKLLGDAEADLPICPYTRTLALSELRASDADQARLHDLLTGRYVMIGAALNGFNDTVLSPVQDVIPGVFMHAMALDNLLTYQGNYKRAMEWEIWPPNALWLLGIPIIMAAHFLHWLAGWLAYQLRTRTRWAKRWLVEPKKWRFATVDAIEPNAAPPRRPAPLNALGTAPDLRSRASLLSAVLRDRDSRHWLGVKVGSKLAIALALALRKIAAIFLTSLAIMAIVLGVQHCVNVGTLPIVDLATMALAAHWLGWTNTVTEFLIGKPRAKPDETSPSSAPAAVRETCAKPQQE